MNFGVLTTGYKGITFLNKINFKPTFVVTYDNKEGQDTFYEQIIKWGKDNSVKVFHKKEWNELSSQLESVDKIFVIGWQFLIKSCLDKLVVFHDSYLPERRGRCPTVCALIDKSPYLGASSFQPDPSANEPDYGKIYYRFKEDISYPISLQQAFNVVVDLYIKMAHNIILKNTIPHDIDFSKSSFSMWRDEEDTRIDWTISSNDIHQKVLTLSYPYNGATCVYEDRIIYLKKTIIETDKNIINRQQHCGKIWKIEKDIPYVVCGRGILKILEATEKNGDIIVFNKIRKKFK